MPTVLQFRRGTTSQNNSFTGSAGEITVDTTTNQLRIHDGSTAGGTTVGLDTKNIQIGTTGDNEIDTSSGNLTIDSAGGTTTIDDNLTVSGDVTISSELNVSGGTIIVNAGHPNGFFNTAFGDNAGDTLNGNQSACTLFGYNSGTSLGICSNNAAFGHATLANNTTGSENTAVGSQTLDAVTTGSNNTGVGREAGGNITTGSNNTCIGADATASSATVSNEVTIGDANVTSLRIPGLQSGASSGDVLTFDGTDLGLAAPAAGGTDWQAVKTSNFTAVAGEGYFINTTSAAITMTLPASPSQGDEVAFIDYAGTADSNNITIARNGSNIAGAASDLTVSVERAANSLVYVDATQGWLLTSK